MTPCFLASIVCLVDFFDFSGGLKEEPQENEFKEVDVDSEAMEVNIGKIIQQEEAVEAITQQFSLASISLKKVFFIYFLCV